MKLFFKKYLTKWNNSVIVINIEQSTKQQTSKAMSKVILTTPVISDIQWSKQYAGASGGTRYEKWVANFTMKSSRDKELQFECWTEAFPSNQPLQPLTPGFNNKTRVMINFSAPNSSGFKGWFPADRTNRQRMNHEDYKYVEGIESFQSLIDFATHILWQEKSIPLTQWQQGNINEIVITEGWDAVSFPEPKRMTFV